MECTRKVVRILLDIGLEFLLKLGKIDLVC